jgi:phage minor structural protein
VIITSLNGQSEILTDYNIRERKRVVNGEYSLPFFVFKTERNTHSFALVAEESIVEYDGQEYRIKKVREYMKGSTPVKEAQTQHVFFDIIDDYQYGTLKGTVNIVQALNHVFGVTDWTWVNQGAFAPVAFENFGDSNALELFQTILERYGAEFEITGARQITLKNQIGAPRDAQFRYRHNIKTLYKDIDSSNVSTYIKGFGKGVTAEYTSPNSSVYGVRHAPPVRDEKFTTVSGLQEHLQKTLIDTPNIVIEIDVVELKNQGLPIHTFDLGDTIYLIHEDLGIDATVRILEYTDYPGSFKSPTVVLANFKNSITKVMSSFQQTSKAVKQLTDADGNLSLQLKRLYRNTDHYSDHTGDWYISPDDPNAYVHIGAGGLDVHRGLVRVERDDGYATIIGGKMNFDFSIDAHDPPFHDSRVSITGWDYQTDTNAYVDVNFFSYRHSARYLRIQIHVGTNDGGGQKIAIFDMDGTTKLYENSNGLARSAGGGPLDITIDLGVPTGNLRSFYLRMMTTVPGITTFCRITRKWLEG